MCITRNQYHFSLFLIIYIIYKSKSSENYIIDFEIFPKLLSNFNLFIKYILLIVLNKNNFDLELSLYELNLQITAKCIVHY